MNKITNRLEIFSKWAKNISYNLEKDHISEYSAQCSYYTILSFIPFLILLITLIQYTNVDQQTLLNMITKFIPSNMNEFIINIIKEIYSKSLGTISISIIFTIWSAGKGLYALMKGLNEVYNITDKKSNSFIYLKIMSLLKTIIFIILIVAGLILLVFGDSLFSILKKNFNNFENYTIYSRVIAEIGFIFFTFIIFLLIYKFMPKKQRIAIKTQIIGALLGAIILNIISLIFSKYLEIFKGFSITYGSLTAIILIMMWTYACFYTLFLGAEINKRVN